jgi:adenine-specific DNA-methyltransferase
MRYLGNKTSLLPFLDKHIKEFIGNDFSKFNHFYDLFSGTGSVSNHFKQYISIIANDFLINSYYVTYSKLLNKYPKDIDKYLSYLNESSIIGDITKHYSEGSKRLYFSKENGMKIDYIRNVLKNSKLEEELHHYLMYCFINSIHKVSNTTGVYGAFLKTLQNNNNLIVEKLPITSSNFTHTCHNTNASSILSQITENDILYLDPPYNNRQYGSNYHLLETIVSDREIVIKRVKDGKESVTGLVQYLPISNWCYKGKVEGELRECLGCKSKYIFMSYNSEGLIKGDRLKEIFEEYGELEIKENDYKRYKSNNGGDSVKNIRELLYCLRK